MNKKIYYDATNNKEIIDVSGNKTDEEIEAMGLTSSKQMIEITDDEATEVIDGILQKFNIETRIASDQAIKDAEILAEREALKTSMDWTDTQLDAILSLAKKS